MQQEADKDQKTNEKAPPASQCRTPPCSSCRSGSGGAARVAAIVARPRRCSPVALVWLDADCATGAGARPHHAECAVGWAFGGQWCAARGAGRASSPY